MGVNRSLTQWIARGAISVPMLDLTKLGTMLLWLKPDGNLGSQAGTNFDVVSGRIEKWWDASPGGRHATASGDERPAYEPAFLRNYASVNIGDSSGFPTRRFRLSSKDLFRNRSKLHIFFVCRFEDTNKYAGVFFASEATAADPSKARFAINLADGTNRLQIVYQRSDAHTETATTSANNTYVTNGWNILDFKLDFANNTIDGRNNGVEFLSGTFTSGGSTDDTDSDTIQIGNFYDFETYFSNYIQEIIVYSSDFNSDADRTKVHDALAAKYALRDDTSFYDIWGEHWFEPIPEGAVFTPFTVTGDSEPGFVAENYDYDINYRVLTSNHDALETIYVVDTWESRITGTTPQGTTRLPNSFILPDASVGNTPNNPCTILNRTTGESLCLNGTARPVAGGAIWGYKDDTTPRTHGGSGLIGGEIWQSELNNGVIPHAIALNVWGEKYLSSAGVGFVAPANKADTDFDDPEHADYYGGNVAGLVMGTRLGIPADVTAESLGITSPAAIAVLNAFKTYGGYIVDNTRFDSIAINCDAEAAVTLEAAEPDLIIVYQNLEIVT